MLIYDKYILWFTHGVGLGTATTLATTTTSGTTTATATAPGIDAAATTMSGGSAAYFASLGLSNMSSRRNVKDYLNGKEEPGKITKERSNKSTNQLSTTTSAKHVLAANQSRSAAVSTATVTNGHSDTAWSSKPDGPTQARPLAPFTSSTGEEAATFSSTPSRDHKQEIRLRREERRKTEGENFRRKGRGEEKHTKTFEIG